MQRHPALQDLSRDHFRALNHVVQVERIVRGDTFARPVADVWTEWQAFWRQDLRLHFQEEEAQLLPLLAGAEREPFADRLVSDHDALREGMALLDGAPDADALWPVARRIREHVRWEENELFESLQGFLDDEELDALLHATVSFRQGHGMPVGRA